MILLGYYQNGEYFASEESKRRLEWLFEPPNAIVDSINRRFKNIVGEKVKWEDVCGVHVRRTDYLNGPWLIPIMLFPKIEFLIFTDDVQFAQHYFKGRATVVNIQPENGPYEDMMMMAACGAQIICNSSFSWWAAYLNALPKLHPNKIRKTNKTVIAPSPWYLR